MKTSKKNGIISVKRFSLSKGVEWFWILASLLLIFGGAAGLVFIQEPLQETQEIRSDASVADGKVLITTSQESDLKVNEAATLYLNINTQNVQTDGVELTFTLAGAQIEEPIVELLPGTGLGTASLEIDETSTGYAVNLIALPTPGTAFTTNEETRFVEISFVPRAMGTVALSFDAEKSISPVHNSDPVEDELKFVASSSFAVVDTGTSAETSKGGVVYSGDTQTVITKTNSQLCNDSCESNSDCAINLACHQGVCRLATNPSSTSCSNVQKKIVYKTVYRELPAENEAMTKGGDKSQQQAMEANPGAMMIGETAADEIEGEVEIPYQAAPVIEEDDAETSRQTEPQTALESLRAMLSDRGLSLSMLMIAAGAALIAIILLLTVIRLLTKNQKSKARNQKMPPQSPQAQQQMQSLEQRIASLQGQSGQTPTPPPTPAPAPQQPVASTPPVQAANPTPTPTANPTPQVPNNPVAQESDIQHSAFSNQQSNSSMLNRIKGQNLINNQNGKTEIFSGKQN